MHVNTARDGVSVASEEFLRELRKPDLLQRPAELMRLATRLRKNPLAAPGRNVRISVLSSFTVDYLVDVLRLMLVRRNVNAQITAAGYGQLIQEILTTGPALSAAAGNVLLLPTFRDLRFVPKVGCTLADAARAVQAEVDFWCDLSAKLRAPAIMLSF